MMTSSNGNIFHVTDYLRGEFTIHFMVKIRSPVNSPYKGQWRGALMFSLICARINGWVNNGEAGDLRRHRAHYDVIVMLFVHALRNKDVRSSLSSLLSAKILRNITTIWWTAKSSPTTPFTTGDTTFIRNSYHCVSRTPIMFDAVAESQLTFVLPCILYV